MRDFDASYLHREIGKPERYGLTWTSVEETVLKNLFTSRFDFERICKVMQRPAAGVLSKLVKLGCIIESGPDVYKHAPPREPKEVEGLLPGILTIGVGDTIGGFGLAGPSIMPLGRTAAVAIKASSIDHGALSGEMFKNVGSDGSSYQFIKNLTEENKMTTKNFEKIERVYIKGTLASSLTDAQIFEEIALIENQAKHLEGIANKPKKLLLALENLKDDIDNIMEYVDNRTNE